MRKMQRPKPGEKLRATVPRDGAARALSKKPPENAKGCENGKLYAKVLNALSVPKQRQGIKRRQNGQFKQAKMSKSSVNSIKIGDSLARNGSAVGPDVKEEVIALGGTEEDIRLIENAPSDSEVEGIETAATDASSKSLKRDLQRLVRDLGVEKMASQELDASSDIGKEEKINHHGKEDAFLQATVHDVSNGKSEILGSGKIKANGMAHLQYFAPRSEWHAAILPILPPPTTNASNIKPALLDRVHQHAKSLLETENKQYASQNTSSAHQFYSTIMSSGTLSDRISALTLSVQESPLHNIKALETLIALARKRSRNQAVEVLGALKDLLGPGGLLPSDRKLKTFASQPGVHSAFAQASKWDTTAPLPQPLTEAHLIVWAYEDWLKSMYFEILKILEVWCNDEVIFARVKAVDYVYQLLREKPEQEANLLRLLVNKLGDSDKKIASRTSYNILQLESIHPFMKPTIISSIESDIVFRPGQSLHAKYYAIITLNQTVLSGKEKDVASQLLSIYFSLFVKLLEKPKIEKPTVSGGNVVTIRNKKGDVQGGGAAPGKKAQRKKSTQDRGTTSDENLVEKLLSAVLTGVNRAIPFTATDDEAFEKHLDTLFRVTHSSNFNTSIQALMLIQQMNSSRQNSNDRFYRTLYESLLDPRLLTSSKQALYLNLIFKALKSDLNMKRVKAFVKRLLQVIAMHQASFTCGTLYLTSELTTTSSNLRSFIDNAEENDSDEEENFQDMRENSDDDQVVVDRNSSKPVDVNTVDQQWKDTYNGRKRDPEHSNADKSCLWELTPFLQHFHPSVSLFASKLMSHEAMPAKPDLSLHTLIHFLDRFVYKNPKSTAGPRGSSIMQPMVESTTSDRLVSARSKTATRQPVNSEAFWKLESDKVDADEVFFHKYFSNTGRGKEHAKKKRAERKARDGSDEADEEEEDEIWKALVDSQPELQESVASDEDIDMEDEDPASSVDDDESAEAASISGQEDDDMLELDDDDDVDSNALLDSDDKIPTEAATEDIRVGDKAARRTEKRGEKRRRLKSLPTFASADDYAAMLEGEDDEGN